MKTSRLLVCVVVRIVVLGINVLALRTSLAQAPLPSDISLISPSPTIAHNIAAFSGAWRGAWGGSFPTALVVEQINQDGTARVIYSWGDELTSGIKAGWIRLTGKILSGMETCPDNTNFETLHLLLLSLCAFPAPIHQLSSQRRANRLSRGKKYEFQNIHMWVRQQVKP